MNRYLYFFLIIVFICPHVSTYSQEEFFSSHDGISLIYLDGFNENAYAIGMSTYLKKGIIIGLGFESVNNIQYPLFAFLICPNWGSDSSFYKFGFGPSYSQIQENHIIGFTLGIVGGLFKESKFPFSINFSFIPQVILIKNKSSLSSMKYSNEFIPIISYGITQAFFAKNNVYPYIGISNAYEIEYKTNFFSANVGINIKLN